MSVFLTAIELDVKGSLTFIHSKTQRRIDHFLFAINLINHIVR